ncbi:MAG: hypothetical protein ACK4TF_09070 [Thermodesulfovibrionales bacterium]
MLRIILILIMSVIISGCASTFLVYKDGKAQYFGSNRKEIQELLCKTGDLRRVFEYTETIDEFTKESLYKYTCLELNGEQVKKVYLDLSPEQRKDLRLAFRKVGYDINYYPCG